jgi:hypothetical protein
VMEVQAMSNPTDSVRENNILRLMVFILVAVATGHLSDREKERHRSIPGVTVPMGGRKPFRVVRISCCSTKKVREYRTTRLNGFELLFARRVPIVKRERNCRYAPCGLEVYGNECGKVHQP